MHKVNSFTSENLGRDTLFSENKSSKTSKQDITITDEELEAFLNETSEINTEQLNKISKMNNRLDKLGSLVNSFS